MSSRPRSQSQSHRRISSEPSRKTSSLPPSTVRAACCDTVAVEVPVLRSEEETVLILGSCGENFVSTLLAKSQQTKCLHVCRFFLPSPFFLRTQHFSHRRKKRLCCVAVWAWSKPEGDLWVGKWVATSGLSAFIPLSLLLLLHLLSPPFAVIGLNGLRPLGRI